MSAGLTVRDNSTQKEKSDRSTLGVSVGCPAVKMEVLTACSVLTFVRAAHSMTLT